MRRARLTLTLLSTLLALTFLVCWPVHHFSGSTTHLGLGRSHRTFEIDAEPHTLTIVLTHLDTPLTDYFPDAPFIRGERYHIWVAQAPLRRIEVGSFSWVRNQGVYPNGSTFMTTSSLSIPYWLALVPALILPALWIKLRLAPPQLGFPLD